MIKFKDILNKANPVYFNDVLNETNPDGPVKEGSGDKKMYSWGQINQALMKRGISTKVIANILSTLAKG